jgi:hypothetical protein
MNRVLAVWPAVGAAPNGQPNPSIAFGTTLGQGGSASFSVSDTAIVRSESESVSALAFSLPYFNTGCPRLGTHWLRRFWCQLRDGQMQRRCVFVPCGRCGFFFTAR